MRSKYLWKLVSAFAVPVVVAAGVGAGLAIRGGPDSSPTRVVAVAVLAGLAVAMVVAWSFSRSLNTVKTAAEAIAGGSYALRVPAPSNDELGRIAQAFNKMSEELRRSMATTSADRNKLTAILSSMVEGVVAVDRDERIVHMNQVAGKLLDAVPEEVLSRPVWEVTRIREVTETLSATLRSEAVGHRVARLPGSTDRYLDLHSSPLRAEGGVLAGAVLVVHDVTRLRRLETIRRDFIGNVSHELKTPITAIRGIVETLVEDPEIDPEVRQRFLGKVSSQAERLSSLVTDLLSLSRLESTDRPLELTPLDVRDVLSELIRIHQPASEARQVTVTAEWDPQADLEVDGEEESLRQAVGNLLSNAIKYSPSGKQVILRAVRNHDHVAIEVIDNGPGIEPRHHERLFERFYRVDAARSREMGGTGLGLAIVKHTALALGGDVSVDSVPGEGSTFRIVLPAATGERHPR